MNKHLQIDASSALRRYGIMPVIIRFARRFLSPIFSTGYFKVLAKSATSNEPYVPCREVQELTENILKDAYAGGEIDDTHYQKLRGHLRQNCTGFGAFKDGQLVGYALVQQRGLYVFGSIGRYVIPDNTVILKNLFVLPAHRGQSIGKQLNAARLTTVPSPMIAVGFVVYDNKYALRNLKSLGFEEYLNVIVIGWRGRLVKQFVWKNRKRSLDKRLLRILGYGFDQT